MTISQRISFLFDKTGKKQKELSLFAGIPTSTISAWRTRDSEPSASNVSTIADFFGVTIEYLLTGEEKNNNNTFSINIADDVQRLLKMYSLLSDMEKGEILGELKVMTKGRASKNSNIQTVLMAARSDDDHGPELVTGDFSDVLNAPDSTDEYI